MDQNEILEQARALGKQLAAHPRVKAYAEAQQALSKDETAKRLLRDYQLLADKLQRMQADGKRPAPQDETQLQKLEQDLATNDSIKAWMRAQSDYVDLMYRIDRTIQDGLAQAMGRPGGAQKPARPGPSQPFIPRVVPGPGGEA